MKGCIVVNDSIFQWRLFVIHKLMSSCMIGFYDYKSLSFYSECLETVHINNQRILRFVNILSKEVPLNISYPSTVNQIYGYLDTRISPTSVGNIISRDKKLNNKNNTIIRSKGGDIVRILIKKNIEGKWLTIDVNEEQHLPYWQLLNKSKIL